MDMQFDEHGHFYLLTYGDGFFNINNDAGMYRWDYVKGQRAPIAVLSATRPSGPAPLTVQFSSEGSRDPDPGDSIRFEWDFDGNGTVDSVDPNPQFTYTALGQYTARLTVIDSSGKSASANTTITVGNTSPTVTIEHTGRGRPVRVRRDASRSPLRSPTRKTARSTAPGRGDVRPRPRRARPCRGDGQRL